MSTRLRPFQEGDWPFLLQLANTSAPYYPEENNEWFRRRREFDENQRIRRHYVEVDPKSQGITGYGSIEQQGPDPYRFRMFVVASPERLNEGIGELLYERLRYA